MLLLQAILLGSGLSAAPLAAPPRPAPVTVQSTDPVRALRLWMSRNRDAELSVEQESTLRALLGDLRLFAHGFPDRGEEIDLVLLDLATRGRPPEPRPADGEAVAGVRGQAGSLGREELEERLRTGGTEAVAWLAGQILDRPGEHPAERRRVAAELLRGRHAADTLPILQRAVQDEDPEVGEAAIGALVGWPDPSVHLFFLEALRRGRPFFPAIRDHLIQASASLGAQARERLRLEIGRLFVSEDWRQAALARHLTPALEARRAAPILLEALTLWVQRAADGRGSRRIQHEIVEQLRRISGRTMGPSPEHWQRWWKGVQEGRVELAEATEERGREVSRPSFFGLRAVSDRVIFILDRSASMEYDFGTSGRSRFDEAVDQLFGFLEKSGEDTRFTLVLFNEAGLRWRTKLVPASPLNLRGARQWLVKPRNGPRGGTDLSSGVREALAADASWRFDPERVEADTVVVLCDGEQTGSSGWLRPVIRQAAGAAQLVFHCVRIGQRGDGVLEALAEGSGGDFIRVDG